MGPDCSQVSLSPLHKLHKLHKVHKVQSAAGQERRTQAGSRRRFPFAKGWEFSLRPSRTAHSAPS